MDADIEGREIGPLMRRALPLVASLLVLSPALSGAAGRAPPRRNTSRSLEKSVRRSSLSSATSAMKALMRDRERRRYRHNWDRAIAELLAAARGKDAAAGFLEAGRARYALYRWSANETDRDKALILANRAAMRGSREGRALANAIRREAGDDAPAVARAPKRTRRSVRPAIASPEREPAAREPQLEPPEEEESPPDPTLEAALADLSAPQEESSLKLGDDRQQGPAEISEVRSWSSGEYSRVAIYLSHWVGWQKLELRADDGQPRRLAFDFRPATLAGKALTRPVAGAQIERVRAAQNAADTVRVVLDLPGRDGAQVFALDDPPRLVVDVGSPTPAAPRIAREEPKPPEEPAAKDEPPAAGASRAPDEDGGARVVRRIVVDAGHGGRDPGAIGRRGLREKDVTLDIAKRVAGELERQGFEVVLTRSDDRFLRLEDRTALANTSGADLFVSIHANANPRRSRSGVETYVLNVSDDRYAARLAARENGGDVDGEDGDAGGGLRRRILADINAVTSAGPSMRLASLVQHEVCRSVRGSFGDVRDLGVKSALFYVLLGARMPAVLVETGFISNAAEEKRLGSPAYRAEVAKAVSRAVRSFAKSDDRVAAVH